MIALVTADQRTEAVVMLFVVAGVLALLALIAALEAGAKPHPIPDVRVIHDTEFDPECPRCGGSGVVDFDDDWLREIVVDGECPRCGGTGLIEDVA